MRDRRIIVADTATKIDLRKLVIDYEGQTDDKSTGGYVDIGYKISAKLKNNEIGSMYFTLMENYPGGEISNEYAGMTIPKLIYIENVDVDTEYQNLGIATLIYKKFGEIYAEQYDGVPVGRYFMNPLAEYAFRKAVAQGWVSEKTLDESFISRGYYSMEEKQLAKDLRNKLPEHVRGNEWV